MERVCYDSTMNFDVIGEGNAALAIETSSASGSVAIGRGCHVLGAHRFSQPRAHAAEFLPSIDTLCRNHGVKPPEIAYVFVSAGPGSFTGLRVGITAARTMALAVGARIVALPTLEVIAQNALDLPDPPPTVCVILDAKRARVYTATFALGTNAKETKQYVAVDDPHESDPASYLAMQKPGCVVLGEGASYHQTAVSGSGLRVLANDFFAPRVETVYRLGFERALKGMFVAARDLIPVYIRLPEAEEVWAARHGSSVTRNTSNVMSSRSPAN
jgi:tRNA threonylcarbamoyladenosine biosynthesis protein TsaB